MSKVIFLSLSIVVAFTLTSAVRKPVDVQVHVKLDNEKQRCKQEGANRCVVPGGGLLGRCCKGLECVSDDPEVACRGPPFPPPASCTCVHVKLDNEKQRCYEEGFGSCVIPGGGLLGQCCKGLECVNDDPEVVCRGPPFPPPAGCTCVKPKNDGQPRCFNEEGASPCRSNGFGKGTCCLGLECVPDDPETQSCKGWPTDTPHPSCTCVKVP